MKGALSLALWLFGLILAYLLLNWWFSGQEGVVDVQARIKAYDSLAVISITISYFLCGIVVDRKLPVDQNGIAGGIVHASVWAAVFFVIASVVTSVGLWILGKNGDAILSVGFMGILVGFIGFLLAILTSLLKGLQT